MKINKLRAWVFFIFIISVLSMRCGSKNKSHELTKYLGKNREYIVKLFGEPIMERIYGKSVRMEYSGSAVGINGTWSYYLIPKQDIIVSADFTAKGEHGDALLKFMIKKLGQPLTVEQLTAHIELNDQDMFNLATKQIRKNYENGMRVWDKKDKGITYFLNIEKDIIMGSDDLQDSNTDNSGNKDLSSNQIVTSIVSIENYQGKNS